MAAAAAGGGLARRVYYFGACEVSLKVERIQRPSGIRIARLIDPLVLWRKAKGSAPVIWRRNSAITAEWVTTTTTAPARAPAAAPPPPPRPPPPQAPPPPAPRA